MKLHAPGEMKKLGLCATAVSTFVLLLFATYTFHALYFAVDVVLYSAILDASLATLIVTLLLFRLSHFQPLGVTERLLLASVCMLGGYAFAITVPTVVDRSLSLYILEKIEQRGGGIQLAAMERVFVEEYIPEYRLIEVRLTEQIQSGTVTLTDGCVKLTAKGRWIASMSQNFRSHLLPKKRLLMDRYSDELTRPFDTKEGATNYSCP